MDSQAANCKTQINVFWHTERLATQLPSMPAVGGFVILLRFQKDSEFGHNPMATREQKIRAAAQMRTWGTITLSQWFSRFGALADSVLALWPNL